MTFQGKEYKLVQRDGNIFDFTDNAKVGEYTRCYDKFIFCTDKGMIAADVENLDNNWEI
jgi:hypothetical protein